MNNDIALLNAEFATERQRAIAAQPGRRCSRCIHQLVCEFTQLDASRAAVARFLGIAATPGAIAQNCRFWQPKEEAPMDGGISESANRGSGAPA